MRGKLVFFLAVVFGLATSVLLYKYLADAKHALDNTEYVKIVVAAQDIPAKTKITEKMVAFKEIPQSYQHPKETTHAEDVVNRILLIPVTAGESIMINQVLDADDRTEGLAFIVPKGKRALTVPVDEVSGIAGLLKPGDSVDVLATVVINEVAYTSVPLQDIEVLAVGKEMDEKSDTSQKDPKEYKTVTLAVTFTQAKRLMMASQRGVIRLMLRSPIDNSWGYSAPSKLEDLLNENINQKAVEYGTGGDGSGKGANPNSK
ncbi:Flp pilus assembly protein CpaB [Candidatus Formimonas warabiya]|uniref:Flp pilus assembly protein CpaB n=1 Tax=Formimonas warabiya TaxID=1761012 RepID=A0A3G1KU38_FORW1|nr:Flp pilus assembly protein CpaB [Candidatus Formimonas warabiya]ATW26023.1 Flp pilus assembly protein CpaB [Candidatus Formimonas warabiya]